MNGNPGVWFEIYVQDMARARKFYESVFQITLQELSSPVPGIEMLTFPSQQERYGCGGALVKMEGAPSGGSSTLIYFPCEDCAQEESRAAVSGGKVHRPKMAIGKYGYISLVCDTEGNMIGLHTI